MGKRPSGFRRRRRAPAVRWQGELRPADLAVIDQAMQDPDLVFMGLSPALHDALQGHDFAPLIVSEPLPAPGLVMSLHYARPTDNLAFAAFDDAGARWVRAAAAHLAAEP